MKLGRKPKVRFVAVETLGMEHFEGIGEAAFLWSKLDFIFRDALERSGNWYSTGGL